MFSQVQHYVNTTYPLAVKLGTITPEGKADVFSYEEDDMVEDPNLANHLGHWGINVQNMQKVGDVLQVVHIAKYPIPYYNSHCGRGFPDPLVFLSSVDTVIPNA